MWFFFAIAYAFITSATLIIAKKLLKEIDEYHYVWFAELFSIPFLFAITFIFFELPKVDLVFFITIGIANLIGVLAAILAYRAIKMSEISLLSPMSAFNPVFTTILAFIFLGEKVSTKGMIGIIAVVIGAYVLQISQLRKGLLEPIKTLFSNRAVQYSLIAYFIWAVTPLFEKTAISHTTPNIPPFVALVSFTMGAVLYIPVIKKFSRQTLRFTKRYIFWFIIIGALNAIGQSAAFMAFNLTNLGIATAVFKLSMVISVILGWLFFKESNIKDRLIGSIIMLIGVFLLIE